MQVPNLIKAVQHLSDEITNLKAQCTSKNSSIATQLEAVNLNCKDEIMQELME